MLVYVFNIDLFEFSAAILEKGLLTLRMNKTSKTWVKRLQLLYASEAKF